MNKKVMRSIALTTLFGAGFVLAGNSAFAANSGDITFSAELLPSTTVTIPTNPVGVNITPSSAGAFGSTSFNVTVSTNQPGYTLSMTTSSTSLASTTINPETNEYFTIPTLDFVSGGYTQSNFTRNRWGISIDGGNYNAIAASQQLKDTDTATNADVTTIGVGANLDLLTASGSYSTTIEFAVVPKITCLSAISGNMQDIVATSSYCDGATGTMTDSRDGTTYHVAKLADGKIWMLDNLALDLTDSTVLNNVAAANTNASATSITALKSGNRTAGDQYATSGVSSNWTTDSFSDPRINMANKDIIPSNAPTNGAGYNKVGGYYNYCAASAGSYCYGNGSSAGTSSGNATEDICPKNWRMPTGGTNGEYAALANIIYGSTGNTADATAIADYRNALSLPLSGGFFLGSIEYLGSGGTFWSNSRASSSSDMYYMSVDTSDVSPSQYYQRQLGMSVRCLVGI